MHDNNTPIPERKLARWTLRLKEVNDATEAMPEEHRTLLRWLNGHAFEKNLTLDEVAELLKKKRGGTYSRDSVYQALTGRRKDVGLDDFVASVSAFKERVEARANIGFPYVDWPRSKRITELCELAFDYQDIVFIYGRSHCGKTTPLKKHAADHPGRVKYTEAPIGGSCAGLKAAIAEKVGVSSRNKTSHLTGMILEAFDPSMILIIDQFHRLLRARNRDALDFIMQLRDERGAGVVLAGTPQAKAEIENKAGPHAEFYRQITNRSIGSFMIEHSISADDLAFFSSAIGLPRAEGDALDLQTSVVDTHSLGKWVKLLRLAMRLSDRKGQRLAWDHVIISNRWLKEQEGK